MGLPWMILAGAYLGLIPFLIGPAWVQFSPETMPAGLDAAWLSYVAMIAGFMAGTFWGFALPAAMGLAGMLGLVISVVLMFAAWASLLLPFEQSLWALAAVYLLLLLADYWRERTLDTIEGYFLLRSVLTVGVLLAIVWRLLLGDFLLVG